MDQKSKPVDIFIAVTAALIVIAVAAFLLLRDDHDALGGSHSYMESDHDLAIDPAGNWVLIIEASHHELQRTEL